MDRWSTSSASETQYYSFHDIELVAPSSPPSKMPASHATDKHVDRAPSPVPMKRQDSGYESHVTVSPRPSISNSRPSISPRRRSTASTGTGSGGPVTRTRTRPSTRRSGKSHYYTNSVHMAQPMAPTANPPTSYFQFPPPDPMGDDHEAVSPLDMALTHRSTHNQRQSQQQQTTPPLMPQTTHYWTSDQTRRLEYAAIDAASNGIKGWVRRHLPDCISAKRHISFDDDTGSVRRYRLELEDDSQPDEKPKKTKSWRFWGSRSSSAART